MDDGNDGEIKISEYKEHTIISLKNTKLINLYNSSLLKDAFKLGNEKGTLNWVIDLSEIQFVDSSGLGILAKQGEYLAKRSKPLILLSVNSGIKNLIQKTGFENIFRIYPDRSFL